MVNENAPIEDTRLNGIFSGKLKKIRIGKIAKYVKGDKNILDLGCDDGHFLNFIEKPKYYLGIDIREDILKKCRKRYKNEKNFKFENVDFNKQKIKSKEKFDYVILSALIEHIDDFENLLNQINLITKKGSKILITTPVQFADHILRIGSKFRLFAKDSYEEHVRYYSKKDFKNINGWNLEVYEKFELGLNQVVVLKKSK
ncbi:MAG: class I SAM-dependent methyltransferase [Candidatus Woesearchaeota archaeon]|jgi:SAM-dependent methyltransferase|nr:class I SAM-dependent methyltransferase [Candidatus Woesearchaeota archaeon]